MNRSTRFLSGLAILLLLTILPLYAMAEEFKPLQVFVHDALTMKYEVIGGSGQYEVVSTSLTDLSGTAVSPSDFKDYSYYFATVIVRDLVTGETATGKRSSLYKDPDWSCKRGDHYVETSESVGESPNYLVGTYYSDITETTHTVLQKIAWHCDRCHAYVYTKEHVNTYAHYFDRSTGFCECGMYDPARVCTHTNVKNDDFYIHSYEIIDDEKHKEILYKELICADCGYDFTDEFWKEQTTTHFFFTGDDECKCGYRRKPECKHTRTKEEFSGNSYVPHEIDPYLHWEVPEYKITCLDCGYVRNETWPGIPYAHEYDGTGYCSACGFKKEPAAALEPLQVSVDAWAYEVAANMNIGATAEVTGGSGYFDCHWSASNDRHQHVQSATDSWSWSITPRAKGTWYITITVHDIETGEKVKATTRAIHVATPKRDKYLSLLRQYSKYENPLNDPVIYDYVWDRLYPYFGEERAKELIQIVKAAPADYRTLYLYTLFDYEILTINHDGTVSTYDSVSNGIRFKKSDLNDDMDLFHEVGHAVDFVTFYTLQMASHHGYPVTSNINQGSDFANSDYLGLLIQDDVKNDMIARMIEHGVSVESAKNVARAIVNDWEDILTDEEKKIKKKVPGYYKEGAEISWFNFWLNSDYENIVDLYGGATGNYVLGKDSGEINAAGHDTWYWKDATKLPQEFWAHYFSARLRNDKDELPVFHDMLPQATKKMDETVALLADMLIAGE